MLCFIGHEGACFTRISNTEKWVERNDALRFFGRISRCWISWWISVRPVGRGGGATCAYAFPLPPRAAKVRLLETDDSNESKLLQKLIVALVSWFPYCVVWNESQYNEPFSFSGSYVIVALNWTAGRIFMSFSQPQLGMCKERKCARWQNMYNRARKAQGRLSSLALMHIHYGTDVYLGEVVD